MISFTYSIKFDDLPDVSLILSDCERIDCGKKYGRRTTGRVFLVYGTLDMVEVSVGFFFDDLRL
jgi:hypothetical protein